MEIDIYKELKKNVFSPLLKKYSFVKKGEATWYKQLPSGVIHVISVSPGWVIAKNDFQLSIFFGVSFIGIFSLGYGNYENINSHLKSPMFRGGSIKYKIKSVYWDSNEMESLEKWKTEISYSLEAQIIPFLNEIQNSENLLSLFPKDISFYIRTDNIVAMFIGCVNFLIGNQHKGIDIIEQIIQSSKVRHEFAEKILERMMKLSIA